MLRKPSGFHLWLAGLLATLATATALIALQPVSGPWQEYGDADVTYVASGLNILKGTHSRFYGHPGLPLQQLMAVTFGVDFLVGRATGSDTSLDGYVDQRLNNLDSTRVFFRGWAIAFYLLGAALAYILIGRLFESRLWGLAGGLLWTGATGLAPLAIQYRPDVVLELLTLVIGYLTIRGFERRDPVSYGLAAFTLGFAIMIKVTAAGMVVPLALAALIHPPPTGWWDDVLRRCRSFIRRRRVLLLTVAVAWTLVAAALNALGWPFGPSPTARILVVEVIAGLAIYLGAALLARWKKVWLLPRVFDPFHVFLVALICVGIALPATLTLGEGVQIFVAIKQSLFGGGATASYGWFRLDWHYLVSHYPTRQAAVIFAIAIVAAVVGLAKKTAWPLIWAAAAVVLGLEAWARCIGNIYYFAPGYIAAVPAALWLFRNSGRRFGLLALPLTLFLVGTTFAHARNPVTQIDACVAPTMKLLGERMAPTDAALTTYVVPDVAYLVDVRSAVNYIPADKVFHMLTVDGLSPDYARANGLVVRYYAGPAAIGLRHPALVTIGPLGQQLVTPLPGGEACGIVALAKPIR